MNKLLDIIDSFLKWFLAILMFLIVAVVCWQVFSRFVLNEPSSLTEELSRCLLIWIGMTGAALAYRTGVHLGLDIVVQRFAEPTRQKLAMLVHLLVITFAVIVMVIGGGSLVSMTYELNQISAALDIRMAYIYLIIPFAGLLITFYGISQLYFLATNRVMKQVEGLH